MNERYEFDIAYAEKYGVVCGVDGENFVSLKDENRKMLLHWCKKRWEKAQGGG